MQNFLNADLILTGGNIITINTKLPRAEAVAVKHGRILAVGTFADIDQFCGSHSEVIELKGRTVVPGFNDAHNHMTGFGMPTGSIYLKESPARQKQVLVFFVRSGAAGLLGCASAGEARYTLVFDDFSRKDDGHRWRRGRSTLYRT
jgi:predicted amidohydrolase